MELTFINQENFKYCISFDENSFNEDTFSVDSLNITHQININEHTFTTKGIAPLQSFENFLESLEKSHNRMKGSSIFYNPYEDSNLSVTFSKDGLVKIILHHSLDEKTRIFRTDTSDQSHFIKPIQELHQFINLIKEKTPKL